jgi:hypothetical protein
MVTDFVVDRNQLIIIERHISPYAAVLIDEIDHYKYDGYRIIIKYDLNPNIIHEEVPIVEKARTINSILFGRTLIRNFIRTRGNYDRAVIYDQFYQDMIYNLPGRKFLGVLSSVLRNNNLAPGGSYKRPKPYLLPSSTMDVIENLNRIDRQMRDKTGDIILDSYGSVVPSDFYPGNEISENSKRFRNDMLEYGIHIIDCGEENPYHLVGWVGRRRFINQTLKAVISQQNGEQQYARY